MKRKISPWSLLFCTVSGYLLIPLTLSSLHFLTAPVFLFFYLADSPHDPHFLLYSLTIFYPITCFLIIWYVFRLAKKYSEIGVVVPGEITEKGLVGLSIFRRYFRGIKFTYMYEGKKYTAVNMQEFPPKNLKVGSKIDVLVDPAKPQNALVPELYRAEVVKTEE
jgi:hypothetical protein